MRNVTLPKTKTQNKCKREIPYYIYIYQVFYLIYMTIPFLQGIKTLKVDINWFPIFCEDRKHRVKSSTNSFAEFLSINCHRYRKPSDGYDRIGSTGYNNSSTTNTNSSTNNSTINTIMAYLSSTCQLCRFSGRLPARPWCEFVLGRRNRPLGRMGGRDPVGHSLDGGKSTKTIQTEKSLDKVLD